jgi:outer membrane immunogenic protein
MRKVLLGTIALLAIITLVCIGPAIAADDSLFSKPDAPKANVASKDVPSPGLPAPAPSKYNWSGWYVGLNVGWGIGKADTTITPLPDALSFVNLMPASKSPNPGGPFGGVQFGYQCERGHFVFGPVTDFEWTGMNGMAFQTPIIQNNGTLFPGSGFLFTQQDTKWMGSFRGKFGYLVAQRFLVYGTGGYAYGRVDYSANVNFNPVGPIMYPTAFNVLKTGWIVGGGAEWAIGSKVRVGGEYLYYDLGDQANTANPVPANPPFQVAYDWQTRAHLFRGFVNLKF